MDEITKKQNILNGLSFNLDVQSETQILNGIYTTSSSSSTNIHYRICNSGWSFFACVGVLSTEQVADSFQGRRYELFIYELRNILELKSSVVQRNANLT